MKQQHTSQRFYLRWPWNLLVYVLLVIVLGRLAIPVILALVVWNSTRRPLGPEDSYCFSRTRRRLSCLLWAALFLCLAGIFFGAFYYQLPMDKTYWDTSDLVLFYGSLPAGLLFAAACVAMIYVGVRDALFPEDSALAKSIRAQLPNPDQAPAVAELFAMVDHDIRENGIWFDRIAVGSQWVLGDEASLLSRIRAVFGRNELVNQGKSRLVQLYILDDRRQVQISTLRDPKELPALIDCLKLRAPDALFLSYGQYHDYLAMADDEWAALEQEYRQRKAQRESRTAGTVREEQNMTLTGPDGNATSRVTEDLIRQTLDQSLHSDEAVFTLTPSQPLEAHGLCYSQLQCAVFGSGLQEEDPRWHRADIYLMLALLPEADQPPQGLVLRCSAAQAESILLDWLRGQAPDTDGWMVADIITQPQAEQRTTAYPQRLILYAASGTRQSHERFHREDVEVAAAGIMDGSYRQVDLTLPGGYLWIQVTVIDPMTDDRCTVTATRADADKLRFFTAKGTARQAASWLLDYYDGGFRPGGSDWKDITRKMSK